jgi:hypothetical protein
MSQQFNFQSVENMNKHWATVYSGQFNSAVSMPLPSSRPILRVLVQMIVGALGEIREE